jgi:hypothetical protein
MTHRASWLNTIHVPLKILSSPIKQSALALSVGLVCATAALAEEGHSHYHGIVPLNKVFNVQSLDLKDQTPRLQDSYAQKHILSLVERFQKQDGSATFTFFRGYVDGFSAKPKTTIPDYAATILESAGLVPSPEKPKRLPISSQQKPAKNWENQTGSPLPYPTENTAFVRQKTQEADKPKGDRDGESAVQHRPLSDTKTPKPRAQVKNERSLVNAIFTNFLHKHRDLFEIPRTALAQNLPNLIPVEYTSGEYFKRITFQQKAGEHYLHSGKTVVLLDHNWNVINISRIIVTPNKLSRILKTGETPKITEQYAHKLAQGLAEKHLKANPETLKIQELILGLDSVRGQYTWKARVVGADTPYQDVTLVFNAADGTLLNVGDNTDRYTDAKVNRWGYSSGDYTQPNRYTNTNFYTRDDNTLVHDFFHVVTDNRNNGDSLHTCNDTPVATQTESAAYGTTSGSNYIRPTRRSDRDFSLWWPSESSGTFGESHVYYWARWFMQWLKPALNNLGVLPNSASNYPQALIIANSCNSGVGTHNSSFDVTVYNNVGEGINTIRLPERCRSSNGNCVGADYADSNSGHIYTYEGNGGYSAPSVIHHELNHFVMKRYFGIGSGKDCGASEQLKFLHEGAAGRSLPQAYWHNYYGTGYAPSNQNRQYRANQTSGRPHTNDSNLNKLSDFLCVDTDSPYNAGSVVHQAMWKFYHGISVNGSTQSSIPRIATDTDFLTLYYWAMDLVSGSTYKDRYEMANRVMQIMENHSALSSSGKQDWCDVWDTHELDNFINSGYCS